MPRGPAIPRPEIPEGFHFCTKCREVKPVGAFCRNRARKSGLAVWCQACLVPYAAGYSNRNHRATYFQRRRHYGANFYDVPIGAKYGELKARAEAKANGRAA